MKHLFLAAAFVAAFSFPARSDDRPTTVEIDTSTLAWVPAGASAFPPGLTQRFIYQDAPGTPGVAIVKFPKGYLEPRHYHTTSGHTGFILKGKLNSDGRIVGPGAFVYFPAGTPHGPNDALEETELLRWADGPLDLHLGDPATPGAPIVAVDTSTVEWQPVKAEGFPEGMMAARLYSYPETGGGVALLKFPKGFREPRHHHTNGDHGTYLISGRMQFGDTLAAPGHFSYAANHTPHGPNVALEDSVLLIWGKTKLDLVVEE